MEDGYLNENKQKGPQWKLLFYILSSAEDILWYCVFEVVYTQHLPKLALLLDYNNIAYIYFNLFWKRYFYGGFPLVKLIAAFSSANISKAFFPTLQVFL